MKKVEGVRYEINCTEFPNYIEQWKVEGTGETVMIFSELALPEGTEMLESMWGGSLIAVWEVKYKTKT